MKPSTAWILLVVAMCGGAYWFATRGQLRYPPPEVAQLELARGDAASSDSCFTVEGGRLVPMTVVSSDDVRCKPNGE